MKILLVEPDQKLAQTYTEYLVARGHAVVGRMGAQSGILAADCQEPDVVILELQLAAHSGAEFLHEFRSYGDWQHIPVIILSNVAPQEFRASEKLLRKLGVKVYLYKPTTSLAGLLSAVEEYSPTPLVTAGQLV